MNLTEVKVKMILRLLDIAEVLSGKLDGGATYKESNFKIFEEQRYVLKLAFDLLKDLTEHDFKQLNESVIKDLEKKIKKFS